MPSPEFEVVLEMLRADPLPEVIAVVEQRQMDDAAAGQEPVPDSVYQEQMLLNGVPGLLLAAEGASEQDLILYLHGGGYAIGSSLTHRDLGWRLSAVSGARVLLLDYRLAPEQPYPAAVQDVLAAYRWLLGHGVGPARLVLAGDSAGGGLAVAALVALRDAGGKLPETAVCLSPWVDLTLSGASLLTNAGADPTLSPAHLRQYAALYLRDTDPATPLASPLFADLAGLPPLFIQAGAAEILLDDARRLAERAEAAGVAVTLDVWPAMFHGWQGFAGVMPEAQAALARIGAFVRERLATRD